MSIRPIGLFLIIMVTLHLILACDVILRYFIQQQITSRLLRSHQNDVTVGHRVPLLLVPYCTSSDEPPLSRYPVPDRKSLDPDIQQVMNEVEEKVRTMKNLNVKTKYQVEIGQKFCMHKAKSDVKSYLCPNACMSLPQSFIVIIIN